jgi:hypothetical protein
MDPKQLELLAQRLIDGGLTPADFARQLASPTANLGDARVDLDRARRCGYPEVVFAQGKSVDTLLRIVAALVDHGADVLATRVSPEQAAALLASHPGGVHHEQARTFRLSHPESRSGPAAGGQVVVVTAGSSDLPVAEEARETLRWMGFDPPLIADVGVAGPQRLREQLPRLEAAEAVVVVAGMEGALPSVVGGYVACPVVAVPTSVGYGASFGGLAALLGMLNSCAANVTVVNIDAGFKAGYVAGLIARRAAAGAR